MDIEAWKQTALIIGTVIGAMITGILSGRKVGKKEPEGDAKVLAASIVPHSEMRDLLHAITGLHGSIKEVAGHLAQMNDRLHEDELVRAAVAKIREEQR